MHPLCLEIDFWLHPLCLEIDFWCRLFLAANVFASTSEPSSLSWQPRLQFLPCHRQCETHIGKSHTSSSWTSEFRQSHLPQPWKCRTGHRRRPQQTSNTG